MGSACSTVQVAEHNVRSNRHLNTAAADTTPLASTAATIQDTNMANESPLRIVVTNMRERETVTTALVLIEGRVENMPQLNSQRDNSISSTGYIQATAYRTDMDGSASRRLLRGLCWPVVPDTGVFKAFVHLPAPGTYNVHLQVATVSLVLHVRFAPPPMRYIVRFHYQKPYDSTQGFDAPLECDNSDAAAIDRIKLISLVLQTALAELLHRAGRARRSFALELGDDGFPIVHVLRSQYASTQAHTLSDDDLLSRLRDDVDRTEQPSNRRADSVHGRNSNDLVVKHVVLLGGAYFDPRTREIFNHREFVDGNVVVVSSCGLHTWPRELADLTQCCIDTTRFLSQAFLRDCAGRGSYWTKFAASSSRLLQLLVLSFGLDSQREGVLRSDFRTINRLICVFEPAALVRLPTFANAIGDGRFLRLDHAALTAVRGNDSSDNPNSRSDSNEVYLDALSADTLAVKCVWIASRSRRRASSLEPRKSAAAA